MKPWIKTLLFVLGTAGLGYYALKVDKAPESEDDSKRPQLCDIKGDSLTEFHIAREKGPLVLSRKDLAAPWMMTEPKKVPASADEARTLAGTFENFRAERTLDIPATEYAAYGLNPPKLNVEARSAAVTASFQVGAKDPSDSYRYLLKEGKVYLVSSYTFERFEKDADEYRSRDLISFDKAEVVSIRYQGRGRKVSLARDGENWKLLEPAKPWKLSGDAVDGLMNQVQNLKVKTFVSDEPRSGAAYGFVEGDQVVTLKTKGGAEYRAQFGSKLKAKPEEVYLRTGAGPAVNSTAATWPENIFKDPVDLRDKAVFDLAAGDLTELALSAGGRSYKSQRTGKPESAGGDKTWVIVEPAGNSGVAAKLTTAGDELAWLRASDFLTGKQPEAGKAGLAAPAFALSYKGSKNGKEFSGWIRLGSSAPDGSNVYASASSVDGIFTLPLTLKGLCEAVVESALPPTPIPTAPPVVTPSK